MLWVFTGGCRFTVVPGSWGPLAPPVSEHGKFHVLSGLSQGQQGSSIVMWLGTQSVFVAWSLPQCGIETLGRGGQGVIDQGWPVAVSLWGLGVFGRRTEQGASTESFYS